MFLPKKSLLTLAVTAALSIGLSACGGSDDDPVAPSAPPAAVAPMSAGFALASHLAVDGVAEIVAATPDGMTLVYTSADAGRLGLIDIADPARPRSLPGIDVRRDGVGEPTSVAVTPDGRYAVVAVRMGDDVASARAGLLRIYDIGMPAAPRHVKDVTIGVGPDSLALVGSGSTLRAVVAIEDEETTDEGEATVPGLRPGRIDVVGLQGLYGAADTGVQSLDLVTALRDTAGVQHASDPQPEFVSVHPDTLQAVVTLQENNAIAIVDLSDPAKPRLARVFAAGTVTRNGDADLFKDGEIRLVDSFTGRREPDAVTWVGSELFALANEGDTSVGEDGVLPGSRSFTLMDTQGTVAFESGGLSEAHAVIHGHYPDSRSAKKGVEIEGVTSGVFAGTRFLFVGSERGSHAEVYRLDDARQPKFVQLLPTGMSPEGLTTVSGRRDGQQLFVSANELDGSLSIYRFHADGAPANPAEPLLAARDTSVPWGALSGLSTDGTRLYAVPDNVFAQSRIFTLDPAELANGRMTVASALLLTQPDGSALQVDPEGVARVADGFWIAAEGKTVAANELIKVNLAGVVQQRIALPAALQARFASATMSTGFEGVAASADGSTLYVALQRGYDTSRPEAAVLKYHLPSDTWSSASYPLDPHSGDAATYWTGLSEIQLTDDGRLLILERDKGGGEAGARTAEIKRVYSVRAADVMEGATLAKTLVKDLRRDHNYLQEKAEGMVLFKGGLWVVNDNDGAGWTRMIDTGGL